MQKMNMIIKKQMKSILIIFQLQLKAKIIIISFGGIKRWFKWKNVQKVVVNREKENNYYCIECGSRLINMKHKRRHYRTGDYDRNLRIADELYQI